MQSEISTLLTGTAKFLVTYLKKILPVISNQWWKECILDNLTEQQLKTIKQKKIKSIESLDLAALLRVMNRNWIKISNKLDLALSSRNVVNEMQDIRNRWAHATPSGYSDDDIYRDLDTIQRFAALINAEDDFIKTIVTVQSLSK